MDNMTCPYCDEGFDYCDDEPSSEDVVDQVDCPSCEKTFVFTRSYSIDYHASKADCLNGSPHEFKMVRRWPRVISGQVQWYCVMCDKKEDRKADCTHGGHYCDKCES